MHERYVFVEVILENVLRFWDKKLNKQELCSQMYHGIRRDMAKELLEVYQAQGSDVYTQRKNMIERLKAE